MRNVRKQIVNSISYALIALAICFSTNANAAIAWTQATYVINEVAVKADINTGYISLAGPVYFGGNACTYNAKFSLTTEAGKAMYSTALAALLAGRKLGLRADIVSDWCSDADGFVINGIYLDK